MTLRSLWIRLRARAFNRRAESELDEELAFHLEKERQRQLAIGATRATATAHTHARFGSVMAIKDRCRDVRALPWLDALMRDVFLACRSLARSPAYAFTVICTITVGLGLNVAVFTVFNAYMLKPDAVRDPYSLYEFAVTSEYVQIPGRMARRSFSWQDYQEFEKTNPVFTEVLGRRVDVPVRIEGRDVLAQLVTGNYFEMLGVPAALGRMLGPSDMSGPGREPVVVISYGAWQRFYDGAADVLNRQVRIGGLPCVIVGVAAEGFSGLEVLPPDIWAPLSLSGHIDNGPDIFRADAPRAVSVIGRLRPDVPEPAARAALMQWAQAHAGDRVETTQARGIMFEPRATPLGRGEGASITFVFWPLLLGFGLVLVMACANVASTSLARALTRRREFETRLALGASRSAVVRQLLCESFVLAVPAAIGAIAIAYFGAGLVTDAFLAALPTEVLSRVRFHTLVIDPRVAGFAAGLGIAVAVLSGLAPALQASRFGLRAPMPERKPWRMRQIFVGVQVTSAALLVVCTALLIRGTIRASRFEPDFNTRDVVYTYARFDETARRAVTSAPFIASVAETSPGPPFVSAPITVGASTEGEVTARLGSRSVSREYFDALGIPIIAGRLFSLEETEAPVAIVSAGTARRLWPDRSPIGEFVRVHQIVPRSVAPAPPPATVQVIGIAADVDEHARPDRGTEPLIYRPLSASAPLRYLVLRVNGDADISRRQIERLFDDLNPRELVQAYRLDTMVRIDLFPVRAASWIAGALGVIALILTGSGIYGVLACLVAHRTREIGIRIALGATVRRVVVMVLRQSAVLVAVGLVGGSLIAFALMSVLGNQLPLPLYAFDTVAYVVAAAVVIAACLIASSVPAMRAARVSPSESLRHD